jgi:hypothetical protein
MQSGTEHLKIDCDKIKMHTIYLKANTKKKKKKVLHTTKEANAIIKKKKNQRNGKVEQKNIEQTENK